MLLKFWIVSGDCAAKTNEPSVFSLFSRCKLRRLINSAGGARLFGICMEMTAAHHAQGCAEVWIRYFIFRVWLIVGIDPFHDIPGHVLHAVGACAGWIRT